jgi:hypothetical protein
LLASISHDFNLALDDCPQFVESPIHGAFVACKISTYVHGKFFMSKKNEEIAVESRSCTKGFETSNIRFELIGKRV